MYELLFGSKLGGAASQRAGAGPAVGDFWVTGMEQVLRWVLKSSELVVLGCWEGGGDPCPGELSMSLFDVFSRNN